MSRKKEVRRSSNFSKKLLGATFLSLFIFSLFFISNSYYLIEEKTKQNVRNNLETIVSNGIINLNPLHLKYLLEKYPNKNDILTNDQDSVYRKVHKRLKSIKEANELSTDVYLIRYDTISGHFFFVASSSDKPYYRHEYVQFPQELMTRSEGGYIDEYESENGQWISAYRPLKDQHGNIVAILEADLEYSELIQATRADLTRNIILFLMIFGSACALLYTYVKKSMIDEDKFKQQLLEQAEEIQSQNEVIRKVNNQLEEKNTIIEEQNQQLSEVNKNLDKKVKERTKELRLVNRDLSNFLYQSSHDIQGPIATLKGLCQIGQVEISDKMSLAYIKKIQNTAEHLEKVLKRISQVYYLKKHEIQKTPVKLKNLLEEVITETQLLVNGSKMDIINNIPEDLQLKSDPFVLKTAFRELIANSITFKNRNSAFLEINGARKKSDVVIDFKDNGIGIPQEARKNVFKMFSRSSELSKGPGLGLYIAKIALGQVDGNIELKKNKEKLTTFSTILPA